MEAVAGEPQAGPSDDALVQFRIVVGLTDTAAKEWQGTLAVTGGELDSAEGWRFSQQDRASSDGRFRFATKVGPFENQL